jgi:hypothetical protein
MSAGNTSKNQTPQTPDPHKMRASLAPLAPLPLLLEAASLNLEAVPGPVLPGRTLVPPLILIAVSVPPLRSGPAVARSRQEGGPGRRVEGLGVQRVPAGRERWGLLGLLGLVVGGTLLLGLVVGGTLAVRVRGRVRAAVGSSWGVLGREVCLDADLD